MKGVNAVVTIGAHRTVAPSGSAWATTSAARRPPAPARFSTMTVVPVLVCTPAAITRAMTSRPLPAAKPTTIFSCSAAARRCGAAASGRAARRARTTNRVTECPRGFADLRIDAPEGGKIPK
jgi:hypothetical protein